MNHYDVVKSYTVHLLRHKYKKYWFSNLSETYYEMQSTLFVYMHMCVSGLFFFKVNGEQ